MPVQYNLLSYVKRFESYETIGGLFREITAQTVELSVSEKIRGLIQQLVSAVADFFSADFDEILTNIIYENKQLNAIMMAAQQLQPAPESLAKLKSINAGLLFKFAVNWNLEGILFNTAKIKNVTFVL